MAPAESAESSKDLNPVSLLEEGIEGARKSLII